MTVRVTAEDLKVPRELNLAPERMVVADHWIHPSPVTQEKWAQAGGSSRRLGLASAAGGRQQLRDESLPERIRREGLLAADEFAILNDVRLECRNAIDGRARLRERIGRVEENRTTELLACPSVIRSSPVANTVRR